MSIHPILWGIVGFLAITLFIAIITEAQAAKSTMTASIRFETPITASIKNGTDTTIIYK